MKLIKIIRKAFFVLLTLLGVVVFGSCSHMFVQVCELSYSDNVRSNGDYLTSENSEIKIDYDFWSERGLFRFAVRNKTDKDLFLVLSRSFYIVNSYANCYYVDVERHSLTTEATAHVYGNNGYVFGHSTSIATANMVVENGKQIVCIPPHSYIYLGNYSLMFQRFTDCNQCNSYPKDKYVASFTPETTPLQVVNRIAYCFDVDMSELKYVNDRFFVSGYTNYKTRRELVKGEECDGVPKSEYITVIPVAPAPGFFYMTYKGTSPLSCDKWQW